MVVSEFQLELGVYGRKHERNGRDVDAGSGQGNRKVALRSRRVRQLRSLSSFGRIIRIYVIAIDKEAKYI
jgi:hypothetical protein